MGSNEQNQHFAELRQKVCSYKHAVVLLRGLPSLDVKKRLAQLKSDRLLDSTLSRF